MAGTVQRQANELSRRTLLAGAATVAGIGAAVAQQPAPAPRVKGPLVWLDIDQKELDDAYDQIKYAPNLAQIVKRYATNSDAVRARLGAPKRLAYGTTPIEGADLYRCQAPECADQRVHPWRRVARRLGARLRFPGRDVRACRRAFRRRSISTTSPRPTAICMPMADQVPPRGRLDLQECGELRRRSRTASMCPATRRAAISAASCWSPTGRRTSACRRTW